MERSTKTLIAVSLFTAALLVAVNAIVRQGTLEDYLLPLLLLLLGLVFAVWRWRDDQPERREAVPEAAPAAYEPAKLVDRTSHSAPLAPTAPDDLTRIEGVGPKMSAALTAAGIDTFARLAAADEATIRAAIEAAGMRFAPSMDTWAEQAAYAARGDWDGLKAFQDSLTAGRRG
jgi:predicted flap endonuclease-1-like 5' DNA nuclease